MKTVLVVLTAIALASPLVDAETETYVAANAGAFVGVPDVVNVGGASFDVPEGADVAAVSVTDDHFGDDLAVAYEFKDAADATLSTDVFCGTAQLTIPSGAVRLAVAPVNSGVSGTITVDFA